MTVKTEWDFSALVKSEEGFAEEKKEILGISEAFVKKWKNREDYLKDPKILKEALDEYEAWERKLGTGGNEYTYFYLNSYLDQNDSELKAKYGKIEDFSKNIYNNVQFFKLKVAKIPPHEQHKFLESHELKQYKHFLENLFKNAKYMLSESEEKIIILKQKSSYDFWTRMVSGFLAKETRDVMNESGDKETKSFSEIVGLLEHTSKKVRDSAAHALNDIIAKNADVAEAELNAILNDKKVDDELRGMLRPDTSRHIEDDIETEIVDKLVEAVSSRFDIAKKYYELKAKLFGFDKLEYHERNVPYGKIEEKYSYEESLDMASKMFSELDGEFHEIFRKFVGEGHIDVFPKKGKSSGAFCFHGLISQPTYIMLNHTDRLKDVLTLAHEVGHGINNEMMKKKQNSLNFGTPKATAEVASTFMEDFILEEILKNADDETRLSIMMSKLNQDMSSIFRQIALYKFEQELHKDFRNKGYLSKEDIGKLFRRHMEAYMGDFVEQSLGSENWWIHWSHIRYLFYVYSYASGLIISKYLQGRVKKEKSFIENVRHFLSAGMSDSPREIFAKMGIDISDKEFWNRGLDEIAKLLHDTEALAKKLGKI